MFLFGKEKVIDLGRNHAAMTDYHRRNYDGRPTATELVRRGYIVIVPAAPFGRPFVAEGAKVFPEFIEKLLRDYKIRDNKFHIAGMSNGGRSAFSPLRPKWIR